MNLVRSFIIVFLFITNCITQSKNEFVDRTFFSVVRMKVVQCRIGGQVVVFALSIMTIGAQGPYGLGMPMFRPDFPAGGMPGMFSPPAMFGRAMPVDRRFQAFPRTFVGHRRFGGSGMFNGRPSNSVGGSSSSGRSLISPGRGGSGQTFGRFGRGGSGQTFGRSGRVGSGQTFGRSGRGGLGRNFNRSGRGGLGRNFDRSGRSGRGRTFDRSGRGGRGRTFDRSGRGGRGQAFERFGSGGRGRAFDRSGRGGRVSGSGRGGSRTTFDMSDRRRSSGRPFGISGRDGRNNDRSGRGMNMVSNFNTMNRGNQGFDRFGTSNDRVTVSNSIPQNRNNHQMHQQRGVNFGQPRLRIGRRNTRPGFSDTNSIFSRRSSNIDPRSGSTWSEQVLRSERMRSSGRSNSFPQRSRTSVRRNELRSPQRIRRIFEGSRRFRNKDRQPSVPSDRHPSQRGTKHKTLRHNRINSRTNNLIADRTTNTPRSRDTLNTGATNSRIEVDPLGHERALPVRLGPGNRVMIGREPSSFTPEILSPKTARLIGIQSRLREDIQQRHSRTDTNRDPDSLRRSILANLNRLKPTGSVSSTASIRSTERSNAGRQQRGEGVLYKDPLGNTIGQMQAQPNSLNANSVTSGGTHINQRGSPLQELSSNEMLGTSAARNSPMPSSSNELLGSSTSLRNVAPYVEPPRTSSTLHDTIVTDNLHTGSSQPSSVDSAITSPTGSPADNLLQTLTGSGSSSSLDTMLSGTSNSLLMSPLARDLDMMDAALLNGDLFGKNSGISTANSRNPQSAANMLLTSSLLDIDMPDLI